MSSGDRWGIATALHNLAAAMVQAGDVASAEAHWEESLAISRDLGDRLLTAYALNGLAGLAVARSDFLRARTLHCESLSLRRELGDRLGITHIFEGLATAAALDGSPLCAATLWSAATRLREEIGYPMATSELPQHNEGVAAARAAQADDAAFDRAWKEGRELTLEQAIEFALKEPNAQG